VVFIILIPLGLVELSKFDSWNDYTILIHSSLLKMASSALLVACGLTFMLWSNLFLLKVGKGGPAEGLGIAISPRTQKLVTRGPYHYSRNPMVFGAFASYLGLVLYLNSLTGLMALLLLLVLAIAYLKVFEEKRLEQDFADTYRSYRNQVPMIFPFLKFKR
jgi:protein-S-isoprenylcysteine O-methyltransferase Ste14